MVVAVVPGCADGSLVKRASNCSAPPTLQAGIVHALFFELIGRFHFISCSLERVRVLS